MKQKTPFRDLFVSDISFDVEEEDLRKLFSVCGTVSAINMLNDKRTGKFNGVAFVRMATTAQARDAVNMLDGTRLENRCINVSAAQAKKTAPTPVVEEEKKIRRPRRPRGSRK